MSSITGFLRPNLINYASSSIFSWILKKSKKFKESFEAPQNKLGPTGSAVWTFFGKKQTRKEYIHIENGEK